MVALVSGEISGSYEPYFKILKEEPEIRGDFSVFVKDLILFSVKDGVYDARSRVCIHYVAMKLALPISVVDAAERSLVQCLSTERAKSSSADGEETSRRDRTKKIKRYLMIGIATVGGGAVLGLTGGLAAPLVAAGAGAFIGGAGAAVLGSAAGVAVISSIMGLAGAGLTGYKMNKRLGEIEEFAFEELTKGQELHVTIAISGWISSDNFSGAMLEWRRMLFSREQYVLRYESKYLLDLGTAIDYLYAFAVSMAAQEALKYTVLSGLIAAIAWPAALISVAGVIDNPWGVCQRRSAQVGRHLAEVLIQRQQGNRPVTLIGFSLGARVIYYCLKELARRQTCEGIVENAVLLGAPVPAKTADWASFKRVVAGSIVNGYCRGDWLLKFVYRTSSACINIAGLQPINWSDRRMRNLDLSDVITGHMDYYDKIDQILDVIGIGTKSGDRRKRSSAGRGPRSEKPRPQSLPDLRSSALETSQSAPSVSGYSSLYNLSSGLGSSRKQASSNFSFTASTQSLSRTSRCIESETTLSDFSEIGDELGKL
ncbi:transmembrane and coiled-coil domain-containing protein 4 [Galendromus occidentalis]|uniref:Transmembrane and coiled-coil domain-containing protein 4 n=1 Tax=Galendromus occidentalis TaxID=34638 RepID=A0AAJ7WHH9_9ACAR|nr:transmembrane and coiled-coil domain-containing protein 4 [Galendromus occidentalis]